MKKIQLKIISLVAIGIMVLILGIICGYLYKSSHSQSDVLPDGTYKVNATWNWKKLTVKNEKYLFDNTRNYEILAQNSKNGIVVLNLIDANQSKKTHVYKIVKSGKQYKWYTVTNGKVSDKVVATATKKIIDIQ